MIEVTYEKNMIYNIYYKGNKVNVLWNLDIKTYGRYIQRMKSYPCDIEVSAQFIY